MAVVVAALAAAVAAALLYAFRDRGTDPEEQLRLICRGDDAQATRLIAAEQRRRAGLTRAQAAARAVESYRRDNR